MRGISYLFLGTASIYVVLGMIWGIQMSASGDHMLAPAHAHLNLIGWVGMAIYGFYYHLVPTAGEKLLAKIHFGVATLGVIILTPGIALALDGTTESPAKAGSVLTLISGLIFAYTVLRNKSK
ncbi:hypothetical protein [Sneathiella limimaris]|uniref:hypothetical protein n=1 Tax=Sneathiella limimaris TaxID=1964213 RepID=UPI00146AD350|nr:hypothetical protein [Sneathiella limimaris]